MEKLTLLFTLLLTSSLYSSEHFPDEEKIFYHIHQAIRWGEIHFKQKSPLANQEMRHHLGLIKYSERNLVKSQFYDEYMELNKLSINMSVGEILKIEKLRLDVHKKAEKLELIQSPHWENEFLFVDR